MFWQKALTPLDFENTPVPKRFPVERAVGIAVINRSNYSFLILGDNSNLIGEVLAGQRAVLRLTKREQYIDLIPEAAQFELSPANQIVYIGQLPEAPDVDVASAMEPVMLDNNGYPTHASLISFNNGDYWTSPNIVLDNTDGPELGSIATYRFNGTTYDRMYNNTQGILLASATRTASTPTQIMTNFNSIGVHIQLNITGVPASPSTGTGLAVVVRGYDIIGNAYNINVTPSNVTAVGEYVYIVYPNSAGTTAQIQQSTSQALPRVWDTVVVVSTTDSYTYSLSYSLIN